MKKTKIIRIAALVLGVLLLIGSIFLIVGVSFPPNYAEIEADFKALMSGSQKINTVLFGEGLPTYERIEEEPMSVQKTGEFYTNADGKQVEIVIYYQKTYDKDSTVYSFRPSYPRGTKDAYVYVSNKEMTKEELEARFPTTKDAYLPEGQSFYNEIYRSEDGKKIGYIIPYEEKVPEFTYTSLDDTRYDYVRTDADFKSVDEIKAEAEKYYSKEFLDSLYISLFDGIESDGVILYPRFKQLERGLAQNNEDEPMFKSHRVFKFETAKIITWGSSSTFVRIEIESYSPDNPEKVTVEELQLTKQGDRWVLNSPGC